MHAQPHRIAAAREFANCPLVVDLADTVPAEEKAVARRNLRTCLIGDPLIVRINGIGTRWHRADLEVVLSARPDAIIIPAAEDIAGIASVAAWIPTIPLIESAVGLHRARKIAAIPNVIRLALGVMADFQGDRTQFHGQGTPSFRLELLVASAMAGLAAPLDARPFEATVSEQMRQEALSIAYSGMSGKLCNHPEQVALVNQAFASYGGSFCEVSPHRLNAKEHPISVCDANQVRSVFPRRELLASGNREMNVQKRVACLNSELCPVPVVGDCRSIGRSGQGGQARQRPIRGGFQPGGFGLHHHESSRLVLTNASVITPSRLT